MVGDAGFARAGTDEPVLFSDLDRIPQIRDLPPDLLFEMRVVAAVLPFRVSRHVLDHLIDWGAVPDDPVFRLTFPRREMLGGQAFDLIAAALRRGAGGAEIRRLASAIHRELNPHPGGQQSLNGAVLDGDTVEGLQHKYEETVLYFPSEGQTCHSFCTFCFRWAQFVRDADLRMAAAGSGRLVEYLKARPRVTDLLVTGGDPFVMKTRRIRHLIEPLMTDGLRHVSTIRFGTKALSFWPQRFLTDPDAEELLSFLASLVERGRNVAVMAHFNHWREVEQPLAEQAVRRLRAAGAVLRSQSPILRGINDDPAVWARMWRSQVNLGIEPYYMFVARDTGAQACFDLPLVEAWRIYREAAGQVSGLARTARGPVMSAGPGKVEFLGPTEIRGERVFALRFLQARDARWCHRPFFAAADDDAVWFDDLKPAFGEDRFFFEDAFAEIVASRQTFRQTGE